MKAFENEFEQQWHYTEESVADLVAMLKTRSSAGEFTCIVKKDRSVKVGQLVTHDDIEVGMVLPHDENGRGVLQWTADVMKKLEVGSFENSKDEIVFLDAKGTQTIFDGHASYVWPEVRSMVKIRLDNPTKTGWYIFRNTGVRVMTVLVVEGKPLLLDCQMSPIGINEAIFVESGDHSCRMTMRNHRVDAEQCLECKFGQMLRTQRPDHMMIRHDDPKKPPLIIASYARATSDVEQADMMKNINAYFGEGSVLAEQARLLIENKPSYRQPTVKNGVFCKRCDEGFERGSCGYDIDMQNCPRCARFIRVKDAFKEVGRFMTMLEELVIGLWQVDSIVVAEVKLRAELTDEDIDLEAMELSAVYDNADMDPMEHAPDRYRRMCVERLLFANDWQGRMSHWRSIAFEMLKTQWKRALMEWPFTSLCKWYDEDE